MFQYSKRESERREVKRKTCVRRVTWVSGFAKLTYFKIYNTHDRLLIKAKYY